MFMKKQKSEFVWLTATRAEYKPSDMEASHLFNATRLVYNNLVPDCRRMEGGRQDLNVFAGYDKDYLYTAMDAFIDEIYCRAEQGILLGFTDKQWEDIQAMEVHLRLKTFEGEYSPEEV